MISDRTKAAHKTHQYLAEDEERSQWRMLVAKAIRLCRKAGIRITASQLGTKSRSDLHAIIRMAHATLNEKRALADALSEDDDSTEVALLRDENAEMQMRLDNIVETALSSLKPEKLM